MPPQDRTRPLIPGQFRLEQRPHLPREQNGIAPLPSVGGDRNVCSFRESSNEPLHGLRPDERLVPEQYHRSLSTTRPQPGEDRRGLATLPLLVSDGPDAVPIADLAQPLHVRADDDDDLVDGRFAQVVENRFYDRLPPELGEQLPAPEPAPAACSQHDRPYAAVTFAHRAFSPPALASALVSGVAEWMGPERSARRPPECPVLSATISAAIAIAVSSGVRAPISRPMGLLMRASCSSVTPSSLRRAVRLSCVLRLPIAPMYPACVSRASLSTGTSNLGSWVRTAITLRPSTSAVCRYSSGQATTISSAEGKRSRVAKTARASQTITRYPMNLPTLATAEAKSMAPNTYI